MQALGRLEVRVLQGTLDTPGLHRLRSSLASGRVGCVRTSRMPLHAMVQAPAVTERRHYTAGGRVPTRECIHLLIGRAPTGRPVCRGYAPVTGYCTTPLVPCHYAQCTAACALQRALQRTACGTACAPTTRPRRAHNALVPRERITLHAARCTLTPAHCVKLLRAHACPTCTPTTRSSRPGERVM